MITAALRKVSLNAHCRAVTTAAALAANLARLASRVTCVIATPST